MNQVVATHVGTVAFARGAYVRVAGTSNWKVWPIEAFDPPQRIPVGQVRIDFVEPARRPYSVVVSARRNANSPLMTANYGTADEKGFVVHLWETIADRTLQNGDFSFAVYQFNDSEVSPERPNMEIKEFLTIQLDSGESWLLKATDGLSEDDFREHLPGPGPSANWIFGHLAVNEDWFLSVLTPQKMQSSAELVEAYQGDLSFTREVAHQAASARPSSLLKQQIIDLFVATRRRTLSALRDADISEWQGPLPQGIPSVYKNIGGVWGIIAVHQYWHLGQLMSIRHMLKKPPVDL